MNASTLIQKLWNYCNILRDDGLSHGDHVEKTTPQGRWRSYAAEDLLARDR
ncbi:MAG TPA: hypothetical protein VE029_00705 [Rhizobacter sp.]|nr:hypothetical protein [Rhizobacter sp.]